MNAKQDHQMDYGNKTHSMPKKMLIPPSGQMNDSDLHPSNSTGQDDRLVYWMDEEAREQLLQGRISRELLANSYSTSASKGLLQDISRRLQGYRRAICKNRPGQLAARIPMRLPARRLSKLRRFLVHKHAFLQDNYPNALVTAFCDWLILGEWGIMRKYTKKCNGGEL